MNDMKNIVKEIKKHEKRYTIVLVAIFMLLILGIGYLLLTVDNKGLLNNINTVSNDTLSLSLSSIKVVLTKEDNTRLYPVIIENDNDTDINYTLVLEKDSNYDSSPNIKYSINNKEMKELDNGIILEGTINKKSKNKTLISVTSDDEFHGVFKIK